MAEAVFDITRVRDPEAWLTAKFGPLADYQLGEVTPSKPKRPPQPAESVDDEPDVSEPPPAPESEPVAPAAAPIPEPVLPVLPLVVRTLNITQAGNFMQMPPIPAPPAPLPIEGRLVITQGASVMQLPCDDELAFWSEHELFRPLV